MLKCNQCEYEAKSAAGLQIHVFRKHTARGRKLAKEAAARMNSPAARKKSQLARARTLEAKRQMPENDPATKRRAPYGSRRPGKRLQRAASPDQVNFCPRCACNLEAVRMAMSFAAGVR